VKNGCEKREAPLDSDGKNEDVERKNIQNIFFCAVKEASSGDVTVDV
jgi:hypothetical protein